MGKGKGKGRGKGIRITGRAPDPPGFREKCLTPFNSPPKPI